MRALLMQPRTRVARARCAKGARCCRARGDCSPCPSPRALHILVRARTAGFHCSSLSLFADSLLLCRLPLSLCRLPLSLCRSSHSANFLCVSLFATSLAERLVSASASSLASALDRSSFSFIYNGGIWTTSNFSKSDSSVVFTFI